MPRVVEHYQPNELRIFLRELREHAGRGAEHLPLPFGPTEGEIGYDCQRCRFSWRVNVSDTLTFVYNVPTSIAHVLGNPELLLVRLLEGEFDDSLTPVDGCPCGCGSSTAEHCWYESEWLGAQQVYTNVEEFIRSMQEHEHVGQFSCADNPADRQIGFICGTCSEGFPFNNSTPIWYLGIDALETSDQVHPGAINLLRTVAGRVEFIRLINERLDLVPQGRIREMLMARWSQTTPLQRSSNRIGELARTQESILKITTRLHGGREIEMPTRSKWHRMK